MTKRPDWLRTVDVEIMLALKRMQPEYIPLVANRLGLHLAYAERRCTLLTEHELIESVTEESIYQATDHGIAILTEAQDEDS